MAGTPGTAYWVNFGASLSGNDDATFDVTNFNELDPVSGKNIGGIYPQGWGANGSFNGAGNDGANTRHLSGWNGASQLSPAYSYHIGGLTVGHTYRLWLANAIFSTTTATGIGIWRESAITNIVSGTGASHSGNIDNGSSLTAGSVKDIWGTIHTAANWLNNQDYCDYVATTADLWFTRAPTSSATAWLQAIGIEDMTAPPPAVNTGSTFMMMGV